MEQFSLEKYLENPSRKITTRYGNREVRIICTDRKAKLPIVALMVDMDGNEYVTYHTTNGWCNEEEKYSDKRDLFFADEEETSQSIEIPFGAFDSEFIKDEYLVPEGCKARIEGNKVIIVKIHKEELTEFEKEVNRIVTAFSATHAYMDKNEIHHYSKGLLDLARKELQPEIDKEIDKAYKNIDTIVYDNGYKQGQYEIMEDLPKWKKAKKDEELDCHVAIQQDDRVVLSDFVQKDEYYITLDILKTLPKEE